MKKFLIILGLTACTYAAADTTTDSGMNTNNQNLCPMLFAKCQDEVKAGTIPATVNGKDSCTQVQQKCEDDMKNANNPTN